MDSEKAFFRLIYIEDEEISTKTAPVEAPGSEKNAPAGAKRRLWKPPGAKKTPPQGRNEGCGSSLGSEEKRPRRGETGGCGSSRGVGRKNAPAGAGRRLWKLLGSEEKTPPQGRDQLWKLLGSGKNAPAGARPAVEAPHWGRQPWKPHATARG